MEKSKVVFIGAGNLATRLSLEMKEHEFEIIQVFSRTEESARTLAEKLECDWTDQISQITDKADLYIFSVKDTALEDLLARMPHKQGLWVHTAGSIPMDVFAPFVQRYGVFYPLQTFSKIRETDFKVIPFFIEAHFPEDTDLLEQYARRMSDSVIRASSEQRRYLHLAAVFANNFSNHMFAIAARLVETHGLPFEALQPLITETAAKITDMHPAAAQTGPAIRYDENVIRKHTELLEEPAFKEIYRMLSQSIHDFSKK